MIKELKDWNIFSKVLAIITDGGANIKFAVRLMKIQHIPFTANKLNLIVQQSLHISEDDRIGELPDLELNQILKTFRNIVGFFKRSEISYIDI